MKKWIKISFSLLMIVILIIPITACNKEEMKDIRVVEVTRSIFYAPQYVAAEKGFLKKKGFM